MRNPVVCLTGGAGRYADKHQIRDELVALNLGPGCLPVGPAFSPWEKETGNYRCATLKTAARRSI